MAGEDCISSVPSHLFVELTSLAELSFPTTASSRIKYTCVCASPHIVAVGSSSGTVYLFSRYASKNRKSLCNVPVQVIPCQEGAITLVEVSPDERTVAVATNRGFLCVLNMQKNHSSTILTSVLHVGAEITCFRYSLNGTRLYAGDSLGRVSCSKLFSKLSLRSPCEMVLRLDSRVVQIDQFHSQLLVSTSSRCYLHNVARQTTCQIGSKLRNGSYGACFFSTNAMRESADPLSLGNKTSNSYSPLVFCARPGGRLWEVDDLGKVYSTHQFAGIRDAWSVPGLRDFGTTAADKLRSITFGCIYVISDFLLSVNGSSLLLVDPKRGKLILVADVGEEISQFCVCANDAFLLTMDGYLRKVTLFPLEKAVEKLQYRERFVAAAQVICAVRDIDCTYPFRADLLRGIREHLGNSGELATLTGMLDNVILQESNKSRENTKPARVPEVARLASGIHKVVKGMDNSGYEDDFTFRVPMNGRSKCSRYERGLSRSPKSAFTWRSKSTPSIDKITPAAGVNGHNGVMVDVMLDGEEDAASLLFNSCPGSANCAESTSCSDGAGCCMSASRSEQSLVTLLRGAEMELQDDQSYGHAANCGTLDNAPHPKERSSSPRERHQGSPEAFYPVNPDTDFRHKSADIDYPLRNGTEILKETLKTGGKLLMDAVQKMSLLNMGPDFGDPSYLVNVPNGFCEEDGEMEDIKGELKIELSNRIGMSKDTVTAHIVSVGSMEGPEERVATEIPVVQRVLRSTSKTRMRSRQPKISRDFGNAEVAVRPRNKKGDNTANSAVAKNGSSDGVEMKRGDLPNAALEAKPLQCEHCGLHNTWRFVLTVGPFVAKMNLPFDCYKEGGIPVDVISWQHLLMDWKRRRQAPPSGSSDELCSACGQLFSTWFARHDALYTLWGTGGSEEIASGAIVAALDGFPESILKRVFFQSERPHSLDEASLPEPVSIATDASQTGIDKPGVAGKREDESMPLSMYYNPLYESVHKDDAAGRNFEPIDSWRWLRRVKLDELMAIGAKIIDMESLTELLLTVVPEYYDELSRHFYRCVSVAGPSCLLNPKILDCIASDVFNLSDAHLEQANQSVGESVWLDINRLFCHCCMLHLSSSVSENDQRVYMFDCGHNYHKICLLSHTKPPVSCLVCARHRQQDQ